MAKPLRASTSVDFYNQQCTFRAGDPRFPSVWICKVDMGSDANHVSCRSFKSPSVSDRQGCWMYSIKSALATDREAKIGSKNGRIDLGLVIERNQPW
jgi:hypothetical protein